MCTEISVQEKNLACDIMTVTVREVVKEYDFIRKAVYSLGHEADDSIKTIGADYEKLYFNPSWVIALFKKNKKKLVEAVIHCVLHSLMLHPSMSSEEDKLFDAAADAAVFCMMRSANALSMTNSCHSNIDKLTKMCGSVSAAEFYSLALRDDKAKSILFTLSSVLKNDDHSVWYRPPEKKKDEGDEQNKGENQGMTEQDIGAGIADGSGDKKGSVKGMSDSADHDSEREWSAMLQEAKGLAKRSFAFGNMHGGMFDNIEKPDRFSRFSYIEYIKRFARSEIVAEDPETIDHVLYNWGIENLGDTPIVEFCETKEQCVVSDIIIAIDMSGSCGGETAVNFLRQIYTLFEQMNIRSTVNINVVTFDTTITSEFTVRSRKDAQRLISDYRGIGWGGTDFICVFDHANEFAKKNHNRKLKGLFFFSDAFGSFPDEKPTYKTTFFVPDESKTFGAVDYQFVPKWVDLVKYNDD